MLAARGELEEALRLLREELLPVFEGLGDVRSLIVGRTNLAILLLRRGNQQDTQEILEHLRWSYAQAVQRRYAEAGQIAEILKKLGIGPG